MYDGAFYSATSSTTINITAVNDAPTGADAGATLAYTEGNGALVIDSTLTLADVDDTNLGVRRFRLRLAINRRGCSCFSNQPESLEVGTVRLEHCRCLYSNKEQYETALESVTYTNSSDTRTTNRTVT